MREQGKEMRFWTHCVVIILTSFDDGLDVTWWRTLLGKPRMRSSGSAQDVLRLAMVASGRSYEWYKYYLSMLMSLSVKAKDHCW